MGMSSKCKKILSKDGLEEMDIKKAVSIDEKQCITRSHYSKDGKGADIYAPSKNFTPKNNKNSKLGKNLAEVFRTDFITAMKVPDSQIIPPQECLTLKDTWRQEWEKGVQVPVDPEKTLTPVVRSSGMTSSSSIESLFELPSDFLKFSEDKFNDDMKESTVTCNYDLDSIDMEWLKSISKLRNVKKATTIDALSMERAITWFERECFSKMAHAVATKEGLSIEYDESTTCNVCLSPDAEDGNEIIFCDACNMCVHQHCYGVLEIPEGNWLCNPCSRGVLSPPCCLCPSKGGAMKRIKDSYEWVHVICAWWVPEVKIEDTKFIERIRKDKIPASRWNLMCAICRDKSGACIQCSVKRCVKAYHVTCAVKEGLEMKTVVVPEKDDVQHISFCSKHCTPTPHDQNPHRNKSGEDIENNRLKELRKLESEFYNLVSVSKASGDLKLPKEVTRRLLSYWTMKRRENENSPLIPLTLQQQEKLSGKQGVVLLNQQKTLEMERFLHLRQDLERLRNLCYMIVRREKVRKAIQRSSMEVFYKQNDILLEEGEKITDSEIDLLRHRTALFNNFSDTYTTEKVWKRENGITDSIYDTTLEEDDLLGCGQFEVFREKDLARDRLEVNDQDRLEAIAHDRIAIMDHSRTSSPNRNGLIHSGSQRNIFEFFKKQELCDKLNSQDSSQETTSTAVTDFSTNVKSEENGKSECDSKSENVVELDAKKKLDFEKNETVKDQSVILLNNVEDTEPTEPIVKMADDKDYTNLSDKIDIITDDKLTNGDNDDNNSDDDIVNDACADKTPIPTNHVNTPHVNTPERQPDEILTNTDNDSVFKKSSLAKKGKKRFRNLNLLDETHHHQQHQRRNSPRLNKASDEEAEQHESTTLHNHRNEDTSDAKLKYLATNGDKKRRRINSCVDFIGENGDEQPDYIRMTRSRVSSCT